MAKGTGPKNLAKSMKPSAGRIKGGHSLKATQPKPLKVSSLRGRTNPSKAS
jgi:hypothetical protein